ncbi:MAG: DMT family transporter [Oscillospiraceae bacterium]|nr:DMT family transporter [Oscillospiraceae bacterium]
MNQKSETAKGYAAAIVTAILWSLGGLLIKLIPWSAMSINAARCLVALLVKIAMRRSLKVHFTPSILLAAFCFFGTTLLFVFANKLTTAANAIVLQYSSTLFIIALTWIFLKRRPSGVDLVSSVLIIAGIALCCFDNLTTDGALGNVLALCSGLTFGSMLFINAQGGGKNADDANYLGFIIGVLVGLPSLARETDFSLPVVGYIVILGAFQLGFAYIFLEYALKRISALSANIVCSFEPILNPVWVALIYGETIGPLAIGGGLLVIASVVFYGIMNARRTKVA